VTGVLVDTSVWIPYFRSGTDVTSEAVDQLIREERAWITGPIVAELLQGVRSRREAGNLESALSVLRYAPIEGKDWETAGNLLRRLRESGITVPLTDALIAVVARRHNIAVLTHDRHFGHLDVRLIDPGS